MNTGWSASALFRFVVALLVIRYFISITLHPEVWHFLDNIDLIIHEAGQMVFIFFDTFLFSLSAISYLDKTSTQHLCSYSE